MIPPQPDKPAEEPNAPDASQQQVTEQQEPPPFSEAYHKAHRNYGFFVALLAAWELIGFEISDAPVRISEAIDFGIRLRSPQGAPYVLMVLVVYFGFRYVVEWHQSALERRSLGISKVDFWTAHLLAASSFFIYLYQSVTGAQIVEVLTPALAMIYFAGGGVVGILLTFGFSRSSSSRRNWFIVVAVIVILGGSIPLIFVDERAGPAIGAALIGLFLGWLNALRGLSLEERDKAERDARANSS